MTKKEVDKKLPIYKLTSKKKVLKYYQNWTKKDQYNKDMIDWQYTAPQNTVNLFKQYVPENNIKILDAGCGSGLVGIELKKNGYKNIVGADFSQSMIDLIPNNLYKKIDLVDLNEPLPFKDDNFDAILCVGTFTYGHVKAEALDEFIRITKNNGFICFTVNEGIYTKYKFDKKIKKLIENNFFDIIELSISNYIENKDVKAWICLTKINK